MLDFTLATAGDAHPIFDLVYRHPDPFLRTATIDDVQKWIRHGESWIVRDGRNVVAACNIKVPETTPHQPAEPAEFGGVFVHPAYRGRGLADAVGVLAISSYFWDNDPESLEPVPLISHVHVMNESPLGLLRRLGFEFDKVIEVPDGVPGFKDMPRDADGRLLGKEFRFPPDRRIPLFRKMADLLSVERMGADSVRILPAFAMTPEALDHLAADLERQMEQQRP